MNGSVAVLIVALAVAVHPDPAPLRLVPGRAGPSRRTLSARTRRAVTVAIGVTAAGLFAGLPAPVVIASCAGLAAASTLLPTPRSAVQRELDRQRLMIHADLLAACLAAGMAVDSALRAASGAVGVDRSDPGDPLTTLDAVAGLLTLGSDPQTAWAPADAHPELVALAAAARRSAGGGIGLADAAREHAESLRREVVSQAQRRAARAGVAITAPLGLCFLPAFVCLGLAPVVIGLLGTLGIG